MKTDTSEIKRQMLIGLSSAFIGAKEHGTNDGEFVRMFQGFIGDAKKESWCMSFVQYCVNLTDKVWYRVDQLSQQSMIFRSEHCMTVWNKSPEIMKHTSPEPGYIVIWNHTGTPNGHTGIVESVNGLTMSVIEGNTSSQLVVDRDGDGVYRKTRNLETSGSKMRIVGYLNPWPQCRVVFSGLDTSAII